MGVKNAPKISAGLINEGVEPSTPVAVVENGTRANERRFYGTLKSLPDLVSENAVKSPALLIIGDVVRNAADLNKPEFEELLTAVSA
jgi:uroporphyrin-III C-methyltransferase/precorrin-2 dehydrogenase/sirohydrochlorin ferrochelatase